MGQPAPAFLTGAWCSAAAARKAVTTAWDGSAVLASAGQATSTERVARGSMMRMRVMMGRTSWSRTYEGKAAIGAELIEPLVAQYAGPYRGTPSS